MGIEVSRSGVARVWGACVLAGGLAAQTTWTGAVSRDWNVAANWTAGVPDDLDDVTVPAVGNLPRLVGIGSCRALSVASGAGVEVVRVSGGSQATLFVHGDASLAADVTGTGEVEFAVTGDVATAPRRTVVLTGGARLASVRLQPGLGADFQDLKAGIFFVASPDSILPAPRIEWRGRTEITTAYALGTPQGLITCPADASLSIGTFYLEWNFGPPIDTAIQILYAGVTSTVTPTGGTIRVPPTRQLAIDTSSSNPVNLSIEVPPGASFRFSDGVEHGFGDHRLRLPNCLGSVDVSVEDFATLEIDAIRGPLTIRGDATMVRPDGISAPQIAAGGQLLLARNSFRFPPHRTSVQGTFEVHGTLVLEDDSILQLLTASTGALGRLLVAADGRLWMNGSGSAFASGPEIQGSDFSRNAQVEVFGRIEARGYVFRDLGPAGLVLGAGSTIGAAPYDLRGGTFGSGVNSPGSTLLTCQRTSPTTLRGLYLGASGNTQYGIRATTPFAVDVIDAFGNVGYEDAEDDPLAVISWMEGISYAGAGTPGCSGLCEARASARPTVGFGEIVLEHRNAPRSTTALLVIGFGVETTPVPLLGVGVYVSPSSPWFCDFLGTSTIGTANYILNMVDDPYFANTSFWLQTLFLDGLACTPQGVSASTAIRLTFAPL